ncbi:MAG: response regulator [Chitinophagaceae bacterium]|nr:MAG: response regulator [Chitinophagaceae bacterium]
MRPPIEKILLVDDDPDDAFLLERALAELPVPIKFHSIEDSDEVIAAVTLHRPDLIFMDMNMPKKNGLECLQALQEQPVLANIPIILYSSSELASLMETAYAHGASLFFRKPSTFLGMVSALRTIVEMDWSDPSAIRARFYARDRVPDVRPEASGS